MSNANSSQAFGENAIMEQARETRPTSVLQNPERGLPGADGAGLIGLWVRRGN